MFSLIGNDAAIFCRSGIFRRDYNFYSNCPVRKIAFILRSAVNGVASGQVCMLCILYNVFPFFYVPSNPASSLRHAESALCTIVIL